MIAESWLWPDHVIGKRASRQLRHDHNATVNSHQLLLEALERLRQCDRLRCNCAAVQAACGAGSLCDSCFAISAIAKAKGGKT